MKKSIISVTNDLATDKRVDKTASTLAQLGFEVTLIGRKLKNSIDVKDRNYKTKRMHLLFNKGPLFYTEYNIRLFFYLIFHKSDLLISNDLDTLLSNYLAYRIKNKFRTNHNDQLKTQNSLLRTPNSKLRTNLVYDSHEYFTGVPELSDRKIVKKIWKTIEKGIFPKLNEIITVNDSIADLYNKEYGKNINVIRNITPECGFKIIKSKKELGLPENKKIIILQGSGININRGAEEAVEAMQFVHNAVLLIIGNGDVIKAIKEIINELYLQEKVFYIKSLPFEELMQYTMNADLGLSFDKDTNINYKYSLPNKIFDYIHAGIPILASPLVEVKKIIYKYGIGETIDNHDPRHIASKINTILKDSQKMAVWKNNLKIAASELCWENEKQKLIKILEKYK